MRALDSGKKRVVAIWHRRSGKDKTFLNLLVKKALERKGSYYYFFPTYKQGKKILWNGMDKSGFKFTDHIPKEIRKRTDNTEMLIELINGSIIQVIGTDNIDSVVGTNPVGCIFSEYSLQNPQAWEYIRPILAENGGWALFNYTPRGKNHGYTLYEMAKKNPKWFVEMLTVDDTKAIGQEVIEEERASGMEEDLIQQEYYCSFEAAIQGAYYSKQFKKIDEDKRICRVPYEEVLSVDTYWDLGVGDSTAIWFVQKYNNEFRFIDYLEATGEGLAYYAKELQDRGYIYGKHYAPHDISVKELGSGATRLETARSIGLRFETRREGDKEHSAVPMLSVDDGINASRMILSKCWFDELKCEKGINALRSYHKDWDERLKQYRSYPEHDWSSHGSDAFRYFAVMNLKPEKKAQTFTSNKKSFI